MDRSEGEESRGGGPSTHPSAVVPGPAHWSRAAEGAVADEVRARHRVGVEQTVVRTEPELLPETPDPSTGLFEIVSPIARRALELGLTAREPSFHVFVAALPEVMIEDDVVRYAERLAARRATPPDLAYVHDFANPAAPKPLVLPSGGGPRLVSVMEELVRHLQEALPALLETEEMQATQMNLAREVETRNRAVLTNLETAARGLGFGVRTVQGGVQTFPILHGKPLSAEQFEALDEGTKRALSEAEERLTAEVEKAAAAVRAQTEKLEAAREQAFAEAAARTIDAAIASVREAVADLGPDVAAYVDAVHAALVEDWQDFVEEELTGEEGAEGAGEAADDDPEHATRLRRFRVNLLVSHEPGARPPVIYETNPTYPNLFGYLERRARFGALLTDFTRVRPGAFHRASGGVLVVRAADLLADPIIWERTKRVLRERRISAEDPLGPLGLYATSLRPVPVPIDVRVVLVGPPELYAALLDADADFAALFRVKVEVEPTIRRTPASLCALDGYLMHMAEERGWGAFDRGARARLLDLATRLAGDREKLALIVSPLEETAAFASALAAARATSDGEPARTERKDRTTLPEASPERPFRASIPPPPATVVGPEDVALAWRERRERLGAAERQIRELTLRGEVALDTSGRRVGVVNGLSVFSLGDVEFGQPMRITAVVALGREGLIDVEREAHLGGSIHTKGVAILRGYLGRMFGQERPLSLRAQIAFEQSYGEIDGDSAASAELFAVLSALADVEIDQGIAVTGSVNQLGEMQAIGGVCAKIEGFFDLCAARGLDGKQGVLLPRANLPHLVLRDDVVEAIAADRFHLYAVDDVAQGVEILTGLAAGKRDAAGRFPASSVFGRVERRLIEIAERLREAEGHVRPEPDRPSHADVSEHDLGEGTDFRGR
jgi:predicted ATP-dependent protease